MAASSSRREELRVEVAAAAAEVRQLRELSRAAGRAIRSADAAAAQVLPRGTERSIAVLFALGATAGEAERVVLVLRLRRRGDASGVVAAARAAAAAVQGCPHLRAEGVAEVAVRPGTKLHFRAALLLAETRLLEWLAGANARGVAAGTLQLAAVLRRCWPLAALTARARIFHLRLRHSPQARRQWCRRFRCRWHVRWRRLPARGDVAPPDVTRRAA
jgi:hypothetical protein